jgi:peptide deformylase
MQWKGWTGALPKRTIRIYGDPCLKEKSAPVTVFDAELKALIADMGETMYESRGVGLAAPQVGVNLRVFVMDTDWVREEGDEPAPHAKRHLRTYINPEIVSEDSEDEKMSEGCLSLPGIEGDVWRPVAVRLRWVDVEGKPHEGDFVDYDARCVQHEFDHLEGVVFVDRLPFHRRQMLAGKLRTLRKLQQSGGNS